MSERSGFVVREGWTLSLVTGRRRRRFVRRDEAGKAIRNRGEREDRKRKI